MYTSDGVPCVALNLDSPRCSQADLTDIQETSLSKIEKSSRSKSIEKKICEKLFCK